MKIKGVVNIATSLDGFIAREDGSTDWLDTANAMVPKGEDCGFGDFMHSIGALVMGRKTYEKVLSFGIWPYGDTPVIVQSRTSINFGDNTPATVSHSSETPLDLFKRLAAEGVDKVYVDGGITIQRFLNENLIDELTVTVIPVLLGTGIPLFGKLSGDVRLRHLKTKAYEFGFVQSSYEVENSEF